MTQRDADSRARHSRRHASRAHALSPIWIVLAVLAVVSLGAGVAAAAAAGRETSLRGQDETALRLGLSPGRETSGAATAAATGTADMTSAVETTPSTPATITIAAVGDLLFDLGPRRLIDAHGGAAPLAKVASKLRSADLTIANLETTLSNRGVAVLGKPAHLIFNGHPKGILSLTSAGVDLVSLANNHAMDHGRIALADTIAALDKARIGHAGAGMTKAKAWAPAYVTVKGRRVAYVAATQVVPSHFLPSATSAGVANGHDLERLLAYVRAAHKKADIVIVSVHWGVEQSFTANGSQKHDARALIDAGADVVLSHHPHVMQGIDTYKGKLIAYSLGNFLFPYKTVEGRKSFILKFQYGPKGVANITATPVYLGQWGRPLVQTGASANAILRKLASVSHPMGTHVTIKNGIGYIKP
jgi:poly-gamma-glutamate synthesis protein (capsule biosynthesis protein)